MEVLYGCCCGMDVHKDTIVACLMRSGSSRLLHKEARTFGTTSADLKGLKDWLVRSGCTIVAMESTSVYWKPVYNILEGNLEILVVNAQHMKAIPGRKTDVADAEWIADLLRHGLLRGSFVPTKDLRELRELVRYRKSLIQERASEATRIQKVLEGANIKVGSVLTDVLGVSGRYMLAAMLEGTKSPEEMAEMAKGRMRQKLPELRQALSGDVGDHQRFILSKQLAHADFLQETIVACTAEIEKRMEPVSEQVELLCTAPGIERKTAQVILAELGSDMSRFPSHKHAASWAGLCPGNNESAGKRKSGRTRRGNRLLRETLIQAANTLTRSKNTYLGAQYRRLASRRGHKKAVVAVAHSLLVITYHILKSGKPYHELGPGYFDQIEADRVRRRLVRRLETLGYSVSLTPAPMAG